MKTVTLLLKEAQSRALRDFKAVFDLKLSEKDAAVLFMCSAMAFREVLYPKIQAHLRYCEAEGLEAGQVVMEKMIMNSKVHKRKRESL